MSESLVIQGHRFEDDDERLRAENQRLRDRIGHVETDLREMHLKAQQTQTAMNNLRRQLNPLYRALQAVFGELDSVLAPDAPENEAMPPRVSAVWQSWKQKMPGRPAEFIDILLQHGEMTAPQLRIAAKCASDTVYQTIHKLNRAGLIEKNNGKFSLKRL